MKKGTSIIINKENITKDELWDMSKRLTLDQAASRLKIGTTKLKKICRLHGMQSWPYRLFQSYFKMLNAPIFSDDDKNKLKTIIAFASEHKFAFREEQKDILHRARQKAYKYEYAAKNRRASVLLAR